MKHHLFVLAICLFFFNSCKKEDDTTVVTEDKLATIKTVEDFNSTTQTGVSMVFFHATHCSICEMQRPTVELIPKNDMVKGKAKFAQVDFDFYKPVFDALNITSFPQIIIYKDGVEKARLRSSGHTEQEIVDLIKAQL